MDLVFILSLVFLVPFSMLVVALVVAMTVVMVRTEDTGLRILLGVIWTLGATAAMRIVLHNYPWLWSALEDGLSAAMTWSAGWGAVLGSWTSFLVIWLMRTTFVLGVAVVFVVTAARTWTRLKPSLHASLQHRREVHAARRADRAAVRKAKAAARAKVAAMAAVAKVQPTPRRGKAGRRARSAELDEVFEP